MGRYWIAALFAFEPQIRPVNPLNNVNYWPHRLASRNHHPDLDIMCIITFLHQFIYACVS